MDLGKSHPSHSIPHLPSIEFLEPNKSPQAVVSSHYPKNVSQYLDQSWDYVITVCGGAKESCPTFIGKVGKCLHIGFDDPDAFTGPDEQIIVEFRRVRDEIRSEMSKISPR